MYSVIIPAYNEEEVINESCSRLTHVMDSLNEPYELVFVNDGSRDKTIDLLKALSEKDRHVKIVDFSRNFGHQLAVTAGLDYASGDAIIIIDADLQDPPEVIPEMIEKWKRGYDVVYGKRLKREGESGFKKLPAFMFSRVLKMMSSQPIPLDTGDFRLIDRKVADTIRRMKENNRFLRGMFSWMGYNQAGVEDDRSERFAGETKYPLKKMLKLAGDGIVSFSNKPLKIATVLGTFLSILSIIYVLLIAILNATGAANFESWNYAVSAICFFQGITLIFIGVLGSYVGRVYDEAKGRPLYIARDTIGFDDRHDAGPSPLHGA